MALIKCTECKKEYSDKAKACPSCGCPAISNMTSEKRKYTKTCSVKIKGSETLIPKTSWISIFTIIVPLLVLWIFLMSLPTAEFNEYMRNIFGKSLTTSGIFIFLIVWGGILFSSPLSKLFPEYKKRKKEAIKINDYFKQRFTLLNTVPANFSNTKIVNTKARTDEEAMFNLYMEAYMFDVDTIVINDSNVSTHINGNVKSNIIASTNTFHITATLVKY